jgi:hypothetical protein
MSHITVTIGACSFCKKDVSSTECRTTMVCGHFTHFVCTQLLIQTGKWGCKTCAARLTPTYQSLAQQSPLVLGTDTLRHNTALEQARQERVLYVSCSL